jgi:uncharacterized protein (TIRG00374 family)
MKGLNLNLLLTAAFLLIVGVLAFVFADETREFFHLLKHADAGWMVLAFALQLPTYIFTGIVWKLSAEAVNYKLPLRALSGLAVEQLTAAQLIPSAGLAGNILVVRAMRRYGLPTAQAIEIFFIETLSYYIAFAGAAFLAVAVLWWRGSITHLISILASAFAGVVLFITVLIWAAVNHKKFRVLHWLRGRAFLAKFFSLFDGLSGERVFSPQLLFETSIFRLGVFVLDAFTLLDILEAIGVETNLLTSFIALVLASMAGAVVALPGGIGGFEAAMAGILVLLGISSGPAITATFLYRVLALWLPLIPGLILARQDLGLSKK